MGIDVGDVNRYRFWISCNRFDRTLEGHHANLEGERTIGLVSSNIGLNFVLCN